MSKLSKLKPLTPIKLSPSTFTVHPINKGRPTSEVIAKMRELSQKGIFD